MNGLTTMIQSRQPLPSEIALYPMAEEVWKSRAEAEVAGLLDVINSLDRLLGGQPS